MSKTRDELEGFNRFVEEKLHDGGADLSLEDCLRQCREMQTPRARTASRSDFDELSAARLLGCVATGVGDLSTNPRHMEGFAKR